MIKSLKEIENLSEVVEMLTDHVLDPDYEAVTEADQIDLIAALLDEFFSIETTEQVRCELLSIIM